MENLDFSHPADGEELTKIAQHIYDQARNPVHYPASEEDLDVEDVDIEEFPMN